MRARHSSWCLLLLLSACRDLPPVIARSAAPGPIVCAQPLGRERGRTIDWSFEHGLEGWQSDAGAQPACGLVMADRVKRLEPLSPAGSYWRTPIDVGQEGQCRLDTGLERRAQAIVSPTFTLAHRYLSLRVGGGGPGRSVQLELEENGFAPVIVVNGSGNVQLGAVVWDVAAYRGKTARLRVLDDGSAPDGILVDAIYDSEETPAPAPAPVWGFADTHAHPLSQHGFGTHVLVGQNEGPFDAALADCRREHGTRGLGVDGKAGAMMALFEPSTDGLPGHVTGGAARFEGWPWFATQTHQQMHVDWIRRAWRGGQRIMIALAVHNELLAREFRGAEPKDDMPAAVKQLVETRAFVGRHGDFMEIAETPADARRIVGAGKLAVVLGVEVDAIGGCRRAEDCHRSRALAGVDELYRLGARHFFPIHLADNAFGGAAVYHEGVFNLLTWWMTGHYQRVIHDDSVAFAFSLEQQALPVWGAQLLQKPNRYGGAPFDPPMGDYKSIAGGHINGVGLTDLGFEVIDELRRRGAVVDVDHMSELARMDTLEHFATTCTPVAMGHSWLRDLGYSVNESEDSTKLRSEPMKTGNELGWVRGLGGVVNPITNQGDVRSVLPGPECQGASTSWMNAYAYTVERMEGTGVGFGSDMNGLAQEPLPRFGPWACSARLRVGGGKDDARRLPARSMRETLRADADAQEAGVTYDRPITSASVHRFFGPKSDHAAYTATERAVWIGIARCKAGATAAVERDLKEERGVVGPVAAGMCGRPVTGDAIWWEAASRVAAAKPRPQEPRDLRRAYDTVKAVALQWSRMESGNVDAPLERYVIPNVRDYDYNLDGLAHYGLVPDFLQDVSNQLRVRNARVKDLRAAFQSAEAYIRMWERAEASKR
ncbi:MAG: membrane dipeptidase [Labilithrix sp.]|nr:membrane dipeptidase [Labilithrix sp.]MCW5815585.1 membrane dipeptidase [Labilithrix sp.]